MTASETAHFERLVHRYHRSLMAYAFGLGLGAAHAEDLVQDALVIAFSRWQTFDREGSFGAWVRGIIRNKYREWARAQHRHQLAAEEIQNLDAEHVTWDRIGDPDAPFHALRVCLERLPGHLRAVVDLFYMKQLSGAETAQRLDQSEANTRKRLQRARDRLAKCIGVTLTSEEA
ncbi:MAG: sigma-70 family RNA polymerase sigma factor [Lentisphaerae bacterium]|jgi:RNA polymerase sigma factor (sigma-70 family)|nr:sigma-70 family RNA polymerase sigma factor [Lentisphaerota bacterium]MBT4818911.1 sigma-70 family RNA polymerase sigma factor [Lentisphaerota bacterium]MBT5612674.1 sigma-70 family RNA polymerase sigma factor [Lentisphaerota bacterium]MBT7056936.1 sigma-70 family RNA polymerase sigma factor [Lentisphaerota bacterium]MBT7841529.1 sigma-70 family RNA polymerase sigma factor [Lentisphaerota bacterium]